MQWMRTAATTNSRKVSNHLANSVRVCQLGPALPQSKARASIKSHHVSQCRQRSNASYNDSLMQQHTPTRNIRLRARFSTQKSSKGPIWFSSSKSCSSIRSLRLKYSSSNSTCLSMMTFPTWTSLLWWPAALVLPMTTLWPISRHHCWTQSSITRITTGLPQTKWQQRKNSIRISSMCQMI